MKLVFDQNISFRILKKIQDVFPDSKQVRELGLENSSDLNIFKYAKEHNLTIVTYDVDFYDLSLTKRKSPKIIWLRTGNTNTDNIARIIRDNEKLIKDFIENNKDVYCLEIY